ncbi:MAG: gas vesicle protein K [Prolixibacteraceae bacterium]
MESNKILLSTGDSDELLKDIQNAGTKAINRFNANPDNAESGLAQLVLTLVELIRKLVEKQAIRRVEGGSLSEEEIERLGETLMKLEFKMEELKKVFNLKDEDLNINLGPLGDLM